MCLFIFAWSWIWTENLFRFLFIFLSLYVFLKQTCICPSFPVCFRRQTAASALFPLFSLLLNNQNKALPVLTADLFTTHLHSCKLRACLAISWILPTFGLSPDFWFERQGVSLLLCPQSNHLHMFPSRPHTLPVTYTVILVGIFTEAPYYHHCVDTAWLSLGFTVITFLSQHSSMFCLGFYFILFYSFICSFHVFITFPA